MDKTTIPGVVFAVGMILLGQHLEGGSAESLMNITAAMIVIGGTLGAVMVGAPLGDVILGLKMAKDGVTEKKSDIPELVGQIVELATIARRDGVLALEGKLAEVKDPFLKRALGFLVDGVEASVARSSLETEIEVEVEERTQGAKIYEAFGGFAPTVGVLGAVLGLSHVKHEVEPQALARCSSDRGPPARSWPSRARGRVPSFPSSGQDSGRRQP
jgi:chemotaxis protein MotA